MIAICLLGSGIDQVSQHLIAVRQKTRQASEILTLFLTYFLLNSALQNDLQNAYPAYQPVLSVA